MAQRTILIVPPKGMRIRGFRIRLSVVIVVLLLIVVGFAGYFIPFDSFTLDVVEQNQKRNLADQNKKLLQRILSSIHLQDELKGQISRLDAKRRHLDQISGVAGHLDRAGAKKTAIASLEPEALFYLVDQREGLFQFFADGAGSEANIFEQIPVNRPVCGKIVISNPFGMCKDPFTGKEKNHKGIDFVALPGTPVLATASGNVRVAENDPIWGKRIVIDHGAGFSTVYAHLGTIGVKPQETVRRGEQIGTIGLSGITTEPHVHYEVWRNGQAVNPQDYFFPSVDSIISPAVTASVN